MKLKKDTCETCGNQGYIFCICHEQDTDAPAIHESICGNCLANRIDDEKLSTYYRSFG